MDYYRPFRATGVADRVKFVHMRMAGMTYRTIAQETGTSPTTVYKWVKRWKKEHNLDSKKSKRIFRTTHREMEPVVLPLSNVSEPWRNVTPPKTSVEADASAACSVHQTLAPKPGYHPGQRRCRFLLHKDQTLQDYCIQNSVRHHLPEKASHCIALHCEYLKMITLIHILQSIRTLSRSVRALRV